MVMKICAENVCNLCNYATLFFSMIFQIGFTFGVKYDLGLLLSFMVFIHRPFLFAQDLHVNIVQCKTFVFLKLQIE